ncbi:peptidoglycan-binding protein [Streptomyces sp. NPDC020996]|uniref:peptidoglycan-binding protein n=1 Tax=Streptomyces sp. NPDC020996 TaxID=3154791 RepID=UPI0033C57274
MGTPVFEEFDPASDCDCPGCAHWRRVLPYSPAARRPAHPAAHRVVIVAAAASAALAAGHAAPALAAPHASHRPGVPAGDEPGTPQGGRAPLHGPAGRPALPAAPVRLPKTTRTEIINRAKAWVAAQVPYSMSDYWSDGYRQDCSGFVSMAWSLPGNEWTGSLGKYGERISKEELQPGDILLFHNPDNPEKGSHVVLFGGWTDSTHTSYVAYEETPPHARRRATPYAYSSNSDRYVPYRYRGIAADEAGANPGTPAAQQAATAYPGPEYFGPGANNAYVTRLGQLLVARGGGRFYASGPGPRWTDADRRATQAFQLAQGWRGADADGLPGPRTWELLVTGKGSGIPASTAGPPASHGVPGYPGRALFRPGASNAYVTRLGRQLVKKGFGAFYTTGPGPRWGEADRRAVRAFQRAQGWRGGAADGCPGPETWRRLFS